MFTSMRWWRYLLFIFVFYAAFSYGAGARAITSDVAISEVLFDPNGSTDTGSEYVVIKNFGSGTANLAGWDLYPDKAGYITFPSFSLPAGASIKVHIKTLGTNDSSNLYYESGSSSNMGNSSGSVALFSSTTHSADTIVSYVRYHKPGSGESKTWETSASSAGIWTTGTFVDTASEAEGKTLMLSNVAQKNNPNGWELGVQAEPASSSESFSSASSEDLFVNSGSVPDPGTSNKMKVYAGGDRTVIAGSAVAFAGNAEGLDGEPFLSTRFLWNFGDGAYNTGQKVEHVFLYPGVYTVSLEVSLGSWSGSDRTEIRVIPNPVFISEITPGENGWIELKNNSSRLLDISGMGISFSALPPFFLPPGTMIAPHAFVVIVAATMGFAITPSGEITLRYANGARVYSDMYNAANLKTKESIARSDDGGWIAGAATPGEEAPRLASPKQVKSIPVASVSNGMTPERTNNIPAKSNAASVLDAKDTRSNFSIPWREYGWLLGGFGIGGAAGAFIIFVRRKYSKTASF